MRLRMLACDDASADEASAIPESAAAASSRDDSCVVTSCFGNTGIRRVRAKWYQTAGPTIKEVRGESFLVELLQL